MRICIVSAFPVQGQGAGGVANVALELVTELLALGVDVQVIPANPLESGQREIPVFKSRVHRVPPRSWPSPWDAIGPLVRDLRTNIDRLNPDLVHVHGPAKWACASRRPTILTIHGAMEREVCIRKPKLGKIVAPVLSWAERRSIPRLSGVIEICNYVRELRPEILGLRRWSIPNPIRNDFFESSPVTHRSLPDDRISIIWVGNSSRRKNFLRFIQICSSVKAAGVPFSAEVCGVSEREINSSAMSDCLRELESRRLMSLFRFRGNLGVAALIDSLDRSHVLVATSLQETAPLIVAEAFSRGVPVVAPRAFGYVDMIGEARGGRLYSLDEPNDLVAEKVIRIGGSSLEFYEKCKARAQSYHPLHVAQETLKVYREVLGKA